uniref:ORF4 n=1 Tax=Nitrosopumilaceae spindle-shaped virus TaxID=3065433 RepID=A0AAT9JEF8_9VIRU
MILYGGRKYETNKSILKRYQKSKYVKILTTFEKGFNDENFREGECQLCGGIFKLAGIGGHLHYKHGVKR